MAPALLATADAPVHRFTVARYDRLIRDEGLTDEDKVELLDGVIYDQMPHNAPHESSVCRLHSRLLLDLVPRGLVVRSLSSINFPFSLPEPDVAVVPGPATRYDDTRPDASELLMVMEVSDTTLARDRGLKQRVYDTSRVPVYWIVNLSEQVVEVYTNPRAGRTPAYRTRIDFRPGDAVPVVVGGKPAGTIPAADLLV